MQLNITQRVRYFSGSKHHSQTYSSQTFPRYQYRSTYALDTLGLALKELESGKSYRTVSEMYNIPRSTLHDHFTGKVKFGASSGPKPYLTFAEEEELASFLINSAKIGYPHTKPQVLAIVQNILDNHDVSSTVTNGWWERFMQRHKHLSFKSAVPLALARAKATDPEVFERYFTMLHEAHDLLDRPECIFNCDETGLAFNPPCFKVVDQKGSQSVSQWRQI